MDDLSKALERLQTKYTATGWGGGTSPTPPLGSISVDGRPTIAMTAPTSTGALQRLRPEAASANPSGSSQPRKSPPGGSVHRAPEEGQALLAAISKLCALQRQYGKTARELETLLDGYLWLLDDVPTADILAAMKEYANTHNDIPTPADIRNIISPRPKELSAALYVSLQKRVHSGEYLLKDEREFCEAFRQQEFAKAGGGGKLELEEGLLQLTHQGGEGE